MQLSVIIVNYNVKYFLEQCLCSVLKASAELEAEIIVVDNNSTDGSREFLQSRFPQIKFIWSSKNEGFSKANNRAAETAKGEFILFLNPDTLVPEDCFKKCIDFFELNRNAGALGVKMIDGSGKFLKESKRALPSPATSLYKLSGLSKLFPRSRTFARYHLGHLSENENHEVDVLAGAFMMIPKKVLNEIGKFDERFFMYGEDVDLSFRIQKAGYRNYYFADCCIIHFKGESTKRGSTNYVRMFYRAMNLFVKKHYRGSRAGIFIILIQAGIWIRAAFSAIVNLFKLIGLPLLDAVIILMSFWQVKYLWSSYVRQDVNYSPNTLIIAFPVFTAIFLLAAYYSGMYDKGYRRSQLFRSTIFATLVLLSGYGLLPESLRFSRGILLFGILTAFVLMNILRRLFIHWRILETSDENDEHRQTVVVSGEEDFLEVTGIMQKAGLYERVLGRINNSVSDKGTALGNIEQLPGLIKKYPVKEIIFCENGLSFKEIIATLGSLPQGIRNKFHASGSSSIVGSDSKNVSGDFVAVIKKYRIAKPSQRRYKRLFDLIVSVFFIIGFPVHIFLQKKPFNFFKNMFLVLTGQKTWVGYATTDPQLPAIKQGIITNTAMPAILNELPLKSLRNSDEWYASGYSVIIDFRILNKGYKYLYS